MNRRFCILLLSALMAQPGEVWSCDTELCGDSDGSCAVSVTDALLQLRKGIGLDGDVELGRDDTTGNGYVSVLDALHTLRRVAGLDDGNYSLLRCPRELVVLTMSSDPFHALEAIVSEAEVTPSLAYDFRGRDVDCRSDFVEATFAFGLERPEILRVALVVGGENPIYGPADMELLKCLVYPSGDDGDEAWFPLLEESHAYFWPLSGAPAEVPLGLSVHTRPARGADW